jgi:hypothetical protein
MGKAATLVMLQPSALCERAYSVDTCTVAAFDAIAAFASQTPAPPRRVSRFFRVWLPHRSPCRTDHSAYSEWQVFISPILSAVDADQTKQSCERCQRETQQNTKYLCIEMWKKRTLSRFGPVPQEDFLCAALSLAHRAFWAKAIFLRAAADMTGFFLGTGTIFPLCADILSCP